MRAVILQDTSAVNSSKHPPSNGSMSMKLSACSFARFENSTGTKKPTVPPAPTPVVPQDLAITRMEPTAKVPAAVVDASSPKHALPFPYIRIIPFTYASFHTYHEVLFILYQHKSSLSHPDFRSRPRSSSSIFYSPISRSSK